MATDLTTRGEAQLRDGRVVITFGVLDGETMSVTPVTLDVDGYALELARDLLVAISEQRQTEDDR